MRGSTSWLWAVGTLLFAGTAAAQDLGHSRRQVDFINRTMGGSLQTVRENLRANKGALAVANIKSVTESLRNEARLTKEIRAKEPGYAPNPPVDFDHKPATDRQKEYAEAKRLALEAAKKLNQDYASASEALLKAKNRQIATIAISALKMTVENAPGRPGGKAVDFVIEGCKQLNGYLMDKYITQPITNISEVQLLKDNFVSIQDGEKLLKSLDAAKQKAMELARLMDQQAQGLQAAVEAEKEWDQFRWLKQPGSDKVTVEIVEYQSRAMQVVLAGIALDAGSKGKVIELSGPASLEAKVKDSRRQFCLDKKKASASMKTIVLEPGPGGAPEDSLVYSSTVNNGRSSWTITEESFQWTPSFNSSVEDDPRPVSGAYWKLEKGRVLWTLNAKPGEQVNFRVTGKVKWHQDQQLPGGHKTQDETNDGSATLVVRVR
ncbi:MAG: hypothetical protein HY901_33955 [Deltaproteobacteria bacterium]|nr:hypothetical protein [Deltaproteobacteria bacterium]